MDHQYGNDYPEAFAGAFEYAGKIPFPPLGEVVFLRDISTIFAMRALLPLVQRKTQWSLDLWKRIEA